MSTWASRQYLPLYCSPRERDRVRECVRRAMAMRVLEIIPEGAPHTVRWEMSDVTEQPITSFEPPRHAIDGRLEIVPVQMMDVRMYRPPPMESLTMPVLTRSAVQELRHRARRAVSRAVGRLAFWRKGGAK